MGWSFACSTSHGKKELLAQLRRPDRYCEGSRLLKSSVVGSNHWYLLQMPDGTRSIGLDKMAGGGHQGMGWGYKNLDESMGPCEVNCPISYLDLASEPTGYAIEWRQKVREYHAGKVKPKPGLVVLYGGHQYKLIEPWAPRKGWRVLSVDTGDTYRMRAHQLAKSKLVGDCV